MKQLSIKLLFTLMVMVPLMFLASCGGDDNPTNQNQTDEYTPVLKTNFDFTVDGNNVNFTTEINGNVWVTANDVDYQFVDKAVTVNLPKAGTYSFTCSSLGSGSVITSDPFDVVIEQDDIEFLNKAPWLYLSGGANKTKTWRMDMNKDGKCVYFDGPVYYSGDNSDPYWSWDVTQTIDADHPYSLNGTDLTSVFNWTPKYSDNTWLMAPNDYGTITFDATNGTVSTTVFGSKTDGTFTYDTSTMKLNFTGGIVIPVDTARLNEGQFTEEDLAKLRIYSISDSAMQIGVKRTYEGTNDDGSQKESKWIMVYNFVVVGYDYPVHEIPHADVTWPDAPSAVTSDDATESAKFDGSWKIKVSGDWRSWYAGFWNFATGMNDAPDTYKGTDQEGNVYWDPYTPSATDQNSFPSDSLQSLTMTFDASAGTLVITQNGNTIASGTYMTDGSKITTDGVQLMMQTDGKEQHAPNTAVIAELPDAAAAGDEMMLAFYECDAGCNKNEWVSFIFVKQ